MVKETVEILEEKLEKALLDREINPDPFILNEEEKRIEIDKGSYNVIECCDHIIIEELHLAVKKEELKKIEKEIFKGI